MIYLAEWVVPILLAGGAIFLAIRPVLRRGKGELAALAATTHLEALPGGASGTAGASGGQIAGQGIPALAGSDGAIDETVSIEGIEGKLRMAALTKVADRVEQSPRETIFIIRNWLAAPESKKGRDRE